MKKRALPLLLLGFSWGLYSCQSAPVVPASPKVERPARPVMKKPQVSSNAGTAPAPAFEENIDLEGLQQYLKMNTPFNRLGYAEKSFKTCEVGFGYSPTQNCRWENFVTIHFQLMCRDSEGTVSQAITQADLQPISRKSVKWNLKNASGVTMTDTEGYAQIAMLSPTTQKNQRLRLTVGNDFLFLRSHEITQMITPKSWCD